MSLDRSERLKNLSAEQRARLLQSLRAENTTVKKAATIPRRALQKAPLSYAQQRLWFLNQLEPGSSAFNVPVAFRMRGDLLVTRLTRVLQEIVRRHEVLRTNFAVENEQPVQIVSAQLQLEVPLLDLSALPPARQAEEVKRQATAEALRPFDLERGPLFRAQLYRLHQREHVLVATGHHIVFDGWSWGVFMQEFATLYSAFAEGKEPLLTELPIQYADFATWQRETLVGAALERQLSYWKEQLAGSVSHLDLPRDHAQTAEPRLRGAFHAFKLPPDLTRALRDLCRQEGVTLYMLLLAAFKTLLHRYSGQTDLVVGSPFANRTHAELEALIGCFMNPLPLRANLAGDPSFREVLRRVREVALNAGTHQAVPFDLLVQAVQPTRDLKTLPLFQALFLLQNFPWKPLDLPGLTVELLLEISTELMYPVALIMAEEEETIIGQLEYAADLYEHSLARLPQHFETLLRGLVAEPEQRISQLPLLTAAERRQMLFEWNDTSKDFSSEQCVHELFEAQVRSTPEAVALVAGEQQLTYAELDRRAEQLARRLKTLGVGPEVRVGICCERSPEMIIGLLAILKAGGAYVPLDPAYPQERLAFMLQEAQAAVLITQKKFLANSNLPLAACHLLCVDADWESFAPENAQNPQSPIAPENLAYVIFTSGSTGQPKGVMIQHRSLVNFVQTASETFAVTPSDRVLQFASISWDTSIEEIFPCLTRGATLVLRTEAMLDQEVFLPACRDLQVTMYDLPTAYWHELIERLRWRELPPSSRLMIIGGERALPERVKTWHDLVTLPVQLMNTYGLTEVTAIATSCDLPPQRESAAREVPIGKPIGNVKTYVRSRQDGRQPAPVGVIGDLSIGGAGIARGYLNRPDLTAERFVPDPFASAPGGRLYQTGDQARHRRDGNLEFFGRLDHQIKIRGFRLELGEVEAALAQHPAIVEAVVMNRARQSGEAHLVGYAVSGEKPAVSDLRRFLLQKLPEYMLPQAFVFLEKMPLTPNGKVNRQALPEPEHLRPELEDHFAAPRTPIEEKLAAIWQKILGINRAGIHDNFFELGGHSLLAIQVVSRIREAFNVEVPLRSLFEASTVAELAIVVGQRCLAQEDQEELAKMFAELEQLSDEEAKALLEVET